MRNVDAPERRFDAVIYVAQRLANIAPIALTALPANGDARRNEKRPVNGLNHLKGRNGMRRARQPVAAIRTVLRMQQTSFGQPLQNLCPCFGRNAKRIGNVFCAGAPGPPVRPVGHPPPAHPPLPRPLGSPHPPPPAPPAPPPT